MSIFWYSVFVLAIIITCVSLKNAVKSIRQGEGFLRPLCIEIFALWLMILPEEWANGSSVNSAIRLPEAILSSLLQVIGQVGNPNLSMVVVGDGKILTAIYRMLFMIVHLILVVYFWGMILQVLRESYQKLRLNLIKKDSIYIFSSVNEKTLRIAETIPRGKQLIFANVCDQDKEDHLKDIKKLNAIYSSESIDNLINKRILRIEKVEIFIFEKCESDNISIVNALKDKIKDSGDKDIKDIRLFMEINSPSWSMYRSKDDYLPSNKITLSLIDTKESFAYDTLMKNSIFEDYVLSAEGNKQINILILGMNDINLQLLKVMLPLSQMPGYMPTFVIFDGGNNLDTLKGAMPEIFEKGYELGDSLYKIIYRENISFNGQSFEDQLDEFCQETTFAFVNVDDDITNIEVAERLRGYIYRNSMEEDSKILLRLKNLSTDLWNMEGLKVVGTDNEYYSYESITASLIEKDAKELQQKRQREKKERNPMHKIISWREYCNNEYNRRSSYARTLSLKYKKMELNINNVEEGSKEFNEDIWKMYEHMRWNVYTRCMGYHLMPKSYIGTGKEDDKNIRIIAKVHKDLLPYDKLSKDEKDKDAIVRN